MPMLNFPESRAISFSVRNLFVIHCYEKSTLKQCFSVLFSNGVAYLTNRIQRRIGDKVLIICKEDHCFVFAVYLLLLFN